MTAIDQIEIDGQLYQFLDQEARDEIVALSKKTQKQISDFTNMLSEESERAKAAEQALEESKMTAIPDKGLSSNDFTDEYKELIDNPLTMLGASAAGDGRKGVVPKPLQGDEGKFLKGDGTWDIPQDTTYSKATQDADGLMSKEDKTKLDNAKTDVDDEVACNTVFGNGVITQTLGNGRVKTITFNADGSITEVIVKSGAATITLNTVFNADGSITRTRS